MSSQAVLVDRQGPVGIMTLNRPELLHRLDLSMLHAIDAAFGDLEGDDAVRVIVITGQGERAFCAGGDIEELKTRGGLAHYRQFGETTQRLFARIDAVHALIERRRPANTRSSRMMVSQARAGGQSSSNAPRPACRLPRKKST